MANFNHVFDKLMKHEGGFVNDPTDKGGATNWGVTLAVWKSKGYDKDGDGDIDADDVKLLTKDDARAIAKPEYWDKLRADDIKNQSVAEFLHDWAYNSGVSTAAKKIQRIVGVKDDGAIGSITIAAINKANQQWLFESLVASRKAFVEAIVKNNPSQKKFYNGWMNRINSFRFSNK